jgi:ABC-type dipeptide/oligopeptide/nickel transport system permease component
MVAFLIRRLFHTVFVMLAVCLVVFVLIRLSGDPASLYLPEDATPAEIEAFREKMGWNRPIHIQYVDFMERVLHGDFGTSLRHNEPALELVLERLPATLELTVVALTFALAIAVPVGVLSAIRQDSVFDAVARIVALLGLCLPNFWFGLMLIIVFAVELDVLPAFGRQSLANLILPGLTLGFSAAATIMRLVRSNVLEVLRMDYVRTARAKGLVERLVLVRHVLKNAAIPTVTIIGLRLGYLLSGAVVTETVFAYPGMGRLAVQAIANRDFAVVQAFVIVAALVFAVANLLVDVLYTFLDPRIRY